MIISWQDHLPAGKVESRPVSSLDVLPTALAAAGANSPRKLDSMESAAAFDGRPPGEPSRAAVLARGGQGRSASGRLENPSRECE